MIRARVHFIMENVFIREALKDQSPIFSCIGSFEKAINDKEPCWKPCKRTIRWFERAFNSEGLVGNSYFVLLGAFKGPSMIKGPVESHAIVLDGLRGPIILMGSLYSVLLDALGGPSMIKGPVETYAFVLLNGFRGLQLWMTNCKPIFSCHWGLWEGQQW